VSAGADDFTDRPLTAQPELREIPDGGPQPQALMLMKMLKRRAYLWAALAAISLYGCGYRMAWYAAWHVPVHNRDGLEWVYAFLLTLPWSLLARAGGMVVIHVGALINGTLFATFSGLRARRRWPTPTS
jgi:hypothetical protein